MKDPGPESEADHRRESETERGQLNLELPEREAIDEARAAVHWSFWVIVVIGLGWNALGVANFFVQMNPEMLEAYRESERALIEGRPAWATAGFAVAVFGGALGCLVLLFRKRLAFYLLVASLLGVVVTMVHVLVTGIDFGSGEVVGVIVMPLAVAAFLAWYANRTGVGPREST